jgi:hypothetical protein
MLYYGYHYHKKDGFKYELANCRRRILKDGRSLMIGYIKRQMGTEYEVSKASAWVSNRAVNRRRSTLG